jgi:hypothetical protein
MITVTLQRMDQKHKEQEEEIERLKGEIRRMRAK